MIWRAIDARKVTLTEVKTGVADLLDILKINAILDMRAAMDKAAYDKANKSGS